MNFPARRRSQASLVCSHSGPRLSQRRELKTPVLWFQLGPLPSPSPPPPSLHTPTLPYHSQDEQVTISSPYSPHKKLLEQPFCVQRNGPGSPFSASKASFQKRVYIPRSVHH